MVLTRSHLFRRLALAFGLTALTAVGLMWLVADAMNAQLAHSTFERGMRSEAQAYAALGRDVAAIGSLAKLMAPGAQVVVADAAGNVIYNNSTEVLAKISDLPEMGHARSRGLGEAVREDPLSGALTRYVAVASPVATDETGSARLYVRLARPVAEADTLHSTARSWLLLAALGAIAAIGLLLVYLVRLVVLPIAHIRGVAGRLVSGDQPGGTHHAGRDELGMLAADVRSIAERSANRIEEVQQTGRRLAAVLAGLSEGVVALDADQQIIHINAAAQRVFHEAHGHPVGKLLWEITRNTEITDAVDECYREGTTARALVEISERTYDMAVTVLRDANMAGDGAIVVLQDVTDLQRLTQVRTEFVANASHELKTPITALKGFVETILDDPDMPEATRQDFLERMQVQTGRLENLVQELITLSRYDASIGNVARRPLDLGVLLQQVCRDKQEDAARVNVDLVFDAARHSPVLIEGDDESLIMLLSNLVDNAFRYGGDGGSVELGLGASVREAIVSVTDHGVGISPAEHDRIFERFYRVDRARSAAKGGTGLGLAIVKHIAQAHGGNVTVRSTPGRGATFSVHLPLADAGMVEG